MKTLKVVQQVERKRHEILPNSTALEWIRSIMGSSNNNNLLLASKADLLQKILAKDNGTAIGLENTSSIGDFVNNENYGLVTVVGVAEGDGEIISEISSEEGGVAVEVVGHKIAFPQTGLLNSVFISPTVAALVYKDRFAFIKDSVSDYLKSVKPMHRTNNIYCSQSLLVSGRAGLAKRSLIASVATELDLPLFYFHLGQELAYKTCIDSESRSSSSYDGSPLTDLMERYLLPCSPCMLLLDGLELLQNSDKQWRDFDDTFPELVHSKLSLLRNTHVFVIGSITDHTKLDGKFKPAALYSIPCSKSIFQIVVEIVMPSLEQRRSFIASRTSLDLGDSNAESLARMTNGQTLKKIDYILSCINAQGQTAAKSLAESLCNQYLKTKTSHLDQYVPEIPRYKWSSVFGYKSLKDKLEQLVVWPLEQPEVYTRLGVTPPSGILLYGPSGCGKTALAHAIASKVSVNFISAKVNQIYGKYLGDSELAIRNLFKSARKAAPCVLFFDGIHVVGTRREWSDSDGAGGVNERVLSTLLNEMDGIENSKGVVVIATTDQVELLDDALTRPGRFDSLIEVPLPSLQDRMDIIEGLCSTTSLELSRADMERFMEQCEGCTGADLYYFIREAGLSAMRSEEFKITADHLAGVIEAFCASKL